MKAKVTILIQLATATGDAIPTNRRIGGWSEGVYYDGPDIATMYNAVVGNGVNGRTSLCAARAALLPTGAQIVGQRYQLFDPVGPSQSANQAFLGTSQLQCDIPQMALLCKVPGVGVHNIRRLIIRGIPDARVVEGEYTPSQAYFGSIQEYFRTLSNFSFRVATRQNNRNNITLVSPEGQVSLNTPIPGLGVGMRITVTSTRRTDDTTVPTASYVVLNIADLNRNVTVAGWNHGLTVGGTASSLVISYPPMDGAAATRGRIITRKVGRPFGQYVGRRSRR